jgi:hypothetical protein
MVDKECNLRAGVYKVQTFGTTQHSKSANKLIYHHIRHKTDAMGINRLLCWPSNYVRQCATDT